MSSDPFRLLGLDRKTATDADVRRAYAERLKLTRPEDDREGFMTLRAAFERARDEVRWRGDYGGDDAYNDESDAGPVEVYPVGAVAIGDEPLAAVLEKTPEPPAPQPVAYNEELDDYDDVEDPAELAFTSQIARAMTALKDVLTASGRPPALHRVMEIIDHDDVAGIEEYRSMQWQVREFLCERTGFDHDQPQRRIPDWLSLDILDALDNYYGWSRQPETNAYVRRMNDWIVAVRREMALDAMPPQARKSAALADAQADLFGARSDQKTDGGGGNLWLWVGAGILLVQVARFVMGMNGGG